MCYYIYIYIYIDYFIKAEHYVKNIVLETKALYLTQLKVRMDTSIAIILYFN